MKKKAEGKEKEVEVRLLGGWVDQELLLYPWIGARIFFFLFMVVGGCVALTIIVLGYFFNAIGLGEEFKLLLRGNSIPMIFITAALTALLYSYLATYKPKKGKSDKIVSVEHIKVIESRDPFMNFFSSNRVLLIAFVIVFISRYVLNDVSYLQALFYCMLALIFIMGFMMATLPDKAVKISLNDRYYKLYGRLTYRLTGIAIMALIVIYSLYPKIPLY